MRTTILASLLPLCLLCAGCGDDTATGPDMSMPDLAVGPDMAMRLPDGVVCGQMSCAVGQDCCVMTANNMPSSATCVSSAGQCSGGSLLACDGPEDCGGGTGSGQFCCATINFTSMPDAGATFNGGNAMCATSCAFNITQGSITTRLCHEDVDCTGLSGPFGTMLNKCCSSTNAPGMHFCANNFGQGGITCP